MTDKLAPLLSDLRSQIESATINAAKAQQAAWRANSTLHRILQLNDEQGIEQAIQSLPTCDVPPSEHRAAHRPGKVRKLDTDAELRAFVMARIDRLAFGEIATDIAARFPPARRVGKSALHAWHRSRKPGSGRTAGGPG